MSKPGRKAQARKEREVVKLETAIKLMQSEYSYDPRLSEELLRKAAKEVVKMKYITPYMASEKFGVPISTAKRLLRLLEAEGLIKLYSPGRRSPIYVPAGK